MHLLTPVTTLDDFAILRGSEMLQHYPFLPAWRFRDRDDVEWLPCLYAETIPGGPISADAYGALKRELVERVRAVLPLDGFYFEGMEDAEADLAAATRHVVGQRCLISTGQDLHGNVSARLVELIDVFTAHRLAPHDDVLSTRERACALLLTCLEHGIRPCRAWTRIPALLPGERTSTLLEPGRTVYARLAESDSVPGVLDASLWVGYAWADEPRSGASVVGTGTSDRAITAEAETISRRYWDARHSFEFVAPAGTAEWCLDRAVELASVGERAIFISDSGDDPTGGGAGDVPHLLGRLIAHPRFGRGQCSAIFASIPDGVAVAECIRAGIGQEVRLSLGGKLDSIHGSPLDVYGIVSALHEDPVGGDTAVIRSGEVSVIVTFRRKPYLVVSDLLALGLNPTQTHVTAIKMGYLFPDLQAAARHELLALTPGAANQDIAGLTFRRVSRPVFPLDPAMTWEPKILLFGTY